MCFKLLPCTSEHPEANGIVETWMAVIMKMVHVAIAEGKYRKTGVKRWGLMNYCNATSKHREIPKRTNYEETTDDKDHSIDPPPSNINKRCMKDQDCKTRQHGYSRNNFAARRIRFHKSSHFSPNNRRARQTQSFTLYQRSKNTG